MELAASGESEEGNRSSGWRTRTSPRPPCSGWTRSPGRARTHVLERPPVAAPQSPPLPARPQTTLPAAKETRDAESFRARRVCERSKPGLGASKSGRGGSGAQAGGDREKSGPRRTPLGLRGASQRGSGLGDPEGKGFSRTQTLQQNAWSGARAQARTGCLSPTPPSYQDALGALGFALFILLIGGRGAPIPSGASGSPTIRILGAPQDST